MQIDREPCLCDRCLKELQPGSGDFFVVSIKAVADPATPAFSKADLEKDLRGEITKLIDRLSDTTAQEAIDQVHRELTFCLCMRCYHRWIENPTGS